MLRYAAHELHHHTHAPARRIMRTIGPGLREIPLPLARHLGAHFEVVGHARPQFTRPAFGITKTMIGKQEVAVTEEVVFRHPFCKLVRFRKDCDLPGEPVLIVAPLSGHFSTLVRGTVEAMLPGHDVWLTDWVNARDVPVIFGTFDLDDYIQLMMDLVRLMCRRVGKPHIMAVCQPGVPVLAAASLMAMSGETNRPASMILSASPIDTRHSPTGVNRMATSHSLSWLNSHAVWTVPWPHFGMLRRVYPGLLQIAGFMSLDPQRHVDAHFDQYRFLVDGEDEEAALIRAFYDEYLSVMDITAEYYLQTVDRVFQRHLLPQGLFDWRGIRVDPSAIDDIGLMTIEGGKDTITGRFQCEAAHELVPNLDAKRREAIFHEDVGHYGVFNGTRFRKLIQPKIHDFIRASACEYV